MFTGHKHSDDARLKMSLAAKRQRHGPVSTETRRKISESLKARHHTGWHQTEETKQKIRDAVKDRVPRSGYKLSEETRRKIGDALRGKSGTPHTEEWKEANRLRHLGRKRPPETGRKISEAKRGKKSHAFTAVCRRKLSQALKGRKHSALHRQRNSAAQKRKFKLHPELKWVAQSPIAKQKRARSLAAAWASGIGSSIERKIAACLDALKVVYTRQVPFPPYVVDIFIPKYSLVVECDGSYWHGTAKAEKYDRWRDRKLVSECGVKVVRLREEDINSDAMKLVLMLLNDISGGEFRCQSRIV